MISSPARRYPACLHAGCGGSFCACHEMLSRHARCLALPVRRPTARACQTTPCAAAACVWLRAARGEHRAPQRAARPRAGDKHNSYKVEDTRGAVATSNPTTIASFTCTGADGKPVGIDAFAGDFALIAFGRAKDHELSASKLMRLRDVIAQSGAPARVPPPWRAWVCSRARAKACRLHARLS